MFGNQTIATLLDQKIETVSLTKISDSSIIQNQVIYDKPKIFTFEFNKDVISANFILEKVNGENRTSVISSLEIKEKIATLSIDSELERSSTYEITIDKLLSTDGGGINSPIKMKFYVSGGPSVSSVNIGSSGVDANARVVVTFNQVLSQSQDISSLVSINGGNATITFIDNQIIFQLHNIPRCGLFSLNINKGLLSQYGIESDNGWSYTSRINCRRATVVIGYSVRGRPIIAYYYGNGSKTILFSGGIHGNEPSSSYLLKDWISHLDSYAYKIPADKQIVIVPDVNPDGLATFSRFNINNVNLDRNFPSSNWKADIDTADGLIEDGGGKSAMSEPETKALAGLTTSLRPRLEVLFHAQGSLIGANQHGDSINIGNLYALNVGYRSMIGIAEETMGYTITGEYEDWVGEQYGIPAILIELPSLSGRYFTAHQSALWKMVNI